MTEGQLILRTMETSNSVGPKPKHASKGSTPKKACTWNNFHKSCPIHATHDKFWEAHHFLHEMISGYHNADSFRYSLNAFLQSLRSTTDLLQQERRVIPDFDNWYPCKRTELNQDALIRRFHAGRRLIVHRGLLKHKSEAEVGLFRNRSLKMAVELGLDPFENSSGLLKIAQRLDFLSVHEFSSLGEQLGIQRTWRVKLLGDGEVTELCHAAWMRVALVVSEAHERCGRSFPLPEGCIEGLSERRVLLESDLDPTLPDKWGWNELADMDIPKPAASDRTSGETSS